MQYGGVVPGDPNDDTDSVSAKLVLAKSLFQSRGNA